MFLIPANDIWICKPCGMNQGKGIYLVRDLEQFMASLDDTRDESLRATTSHRQMERIVQKCDAYVTFPC